MDMGHMDAGATQGGAGHSPASPLLGPRRGPLATQAGYAVAAAIAWILAGALGIYASMPPAPVRADGPGDQVSGDRAFEALERIARDGGGRLSEPRPVGASANIACRLRIEEELRRVGLEPSVQEAFGSYPRHRSAGTVRNIVARLRGTGAPSGERQAVLCMAHYDSVPAGPGIGDDLAGVAAWLEVARALKAKQPLRRDIIFLFEDGEEQGLLGAEVFAAQHPWSKDVGAVINLEGRGTKGASRMFETGADNGWIMRAFAGEASEPSASSISTEIYRRMPNDTDYTVWRERGIPGLNFAFIGGATSYHTPLDDLEALSRATLQHHAQNGLDAVRALDAAEIPGADAMPSGDAVFFDWPGLGLVTFSYSAARALSVIALVLSFLVAALWLRRREVRLRGVLGGFVYLAFAVAAVLLGGLGVRLALVELGVAPIEFVSRPGFLVAATLSGALLGLTLVGWLLGRFFGAAEVAVAAGILLGLGAMALGFSITGGAHLLLVPSLGLGVGMLCCAGSRDRTLGTAVAATFALALTGLLWAPLHLALVDAFGTSSGLIVAAPLAVGALLFSIPMAGGSAATPWLGLATGLVGLASGGLAAYFPVYSSLAPAHVDILLTSEAGSSSVRLRGSRSALAWFQRSAGADFVREDFDEEVGGRTQLEILDRGTRADGTGYVRLSVTPQEGSNLLSLTADGAKALSVDGHPGPVFRTNILGPSQDGHVITLDLTAGVPVNITAQDTCFGLDGGRYRRFVGRWLEGRPDDTVPSQSGDRYELTTRWKLPKDGAVGPLEAIGR